LIARNFLRQLGLGYTSKSFNCLFTLHLLGNFEKCISFGHGPSAFGCVPALATGSVFAMICLGLWLFVRTGKLVAFRPRWQACYFSFYSV